MPSADPNLIESHSTTNLITHDNQNTSYYYGNDIGVKNSINDDQVSVSTTTSHPKRITQKLSSRILSLFYSMSMTVGFSLNYASFIRFPYLSHTFGGGAFIIPYFVLLLLLGIPLIILDYSLGSISKKSIVFALGRWNRRFSGVGMAAVIFGSLLISSYYSVIISWIGVYFANMFNNP